jgi:hypothetical protein
MGMGLQERFRFKPFKKRRPGSMIIQKSDLVHEIHQNNTGKTAIPHPKLGAIDVLNYTPDGLDPHVFDACPDFEISETIAVL